MQRNYMAHGGRELVIGGRLTFLEGAEIVNFPGNAAQSSDSKPTIIPAGPVKDSEATTVAALRADFNALLATLRKAGLLAAGDEGSDHE